MEMWVATAAQMKQVERQAAETGLSYRQMMEHAGWAATAYLMRCQPIAGKRIAVFAGKGNNGGDGFVCARLLCQAGAQVAVVLADGAPVTGDAAAMYEMLGGLSVELVKMEAAAHADIFIDAMYGTGFHGQLRPAARQAAAVMNGGRGMVYALDMPSGVCADTGEAADGAVRAAHTVAFDSLKPAHISLLGRALCGQIVCADIGIPDACHHETGCVQAIKKEVHFAGQVSYTDMEAWR